MRNFLIAFLRDEEGLTMVEYAVAGTLITLAAVTAFTNLGTAVTTKITAIVTALNGGGAAGWSLKLTRGLSFAATTAGLAAGFGNFARRRRYLKRRAHARPAGISGT
jgi:pilus assembly protein Flp/PilA